MTDAEKVELGLMEEKDTWYFKKMHVEAVRVRSGLYGEVLKEWEDFDGCGDGFRVPYFVLLVKDSHGEPEAAVIVKVNESGVFSKCKSGGWAKFA